VERRIASKGAYHLFLKKGNPVVYALDEMLMVDSFHRLDSSSLPNYIYKPVNNYRNPCSSYGRSEIPYPLNDLTKAFTWPLTCVKDCFDKIL